MRGVLPGAVARLFPCKSRFVLLPDGQRMHYVDEGRGPLTLFLHDIPLWSFYFRNLIRDLGERFRCVAPDYPGFGLSDRDAAVPCSLRSISDAVVGFATRLNFGKFNLVLHGWGGVPGMYIALRWPERVGRIVLLNANCFLDFPPTLELLSYRSAGKLLVNFLNRPVQRAAFTAKIGSYSRRGYRFPYRSWSSRTPMRDFYANLPLDGADPEADWLRALQEKLHILANKKAIAFWGLRDGLFGRGVLENWNGQFEGMKIHSFPTSGRYALEDEYETIFPHLRRFLVAGMEAKLPDFLH